ncbi:ParA family protein [Lactobacillus sp. ESL0233]|uniref:ParA family protein n=1 Tax=Lactobacillus sp. ESL0233 TaxID=2069354 RepID=UPI000EFB4CD4|nr:ParA family protein [Lactobacillus sp. ESL0233]RMC39063.1 ParA family protein [Lactobacillus sp. ESL0233]
MKIITFSAIKGGVGKTTLTFNFGEWLSAKGNNVLLIDSDHQCSLTQTYDIYTTEGTIASIFDKSGEAKIIELHKNLSLIPASMDLDSVNNELQTKPNKELLMYMWVADHYNKLKEFDYIIIDTHPDFSTITQNMIAISDFVFSPIEPSEYGFISKTTLELRLKQLKDEVINVQTRESFVTAELKFIGNRIKSNTKSSKEFVEKMMEDSKTIAMIPEREVVNKSTLDHEPLVEMEGETGLSKSNKEFLSKIDKVFEKMSK